MAGFVVVAEVLVSMASMRIEGSAALVLHRQVHLISAFHDILITWLSRGRRPR